MLSSRHLPVLDGYTLRIAYADFRTPGGLNVEGVGVTPDQTAGAGDAAVFAATAGSALSAEGAWAKPGGRAPPVDLSARISTLFLGSGRGRG
jgi:C-terminal processing protease CtpA/Prc